MPAELAFSYLVFCDFLGFSRLICDAAESDDSEELPRLFNRLRAAVEDGMSVFDDKDARYRRYERDKHFKLFSDNLALMLPIDLHRYLDEANFGMLNMDLALYQLKMTQYGFFIRGGFALGQAYMDADLVFGVPLIEAHIIESKEAVFPRIMLSDDVKMLVQHHLTQYNPIEESPQQRFLLCDVEDETNVKVFINYLGATIFDDVVDWKAIQMHKEAIEENLALNQDDDRVRPKYLWLAGYHNYFCGMVSGFQGYSPDLLVSEVPALTTLRTVAETLEPQRLDLPGY